MPTVNMSTPVGELVVQNTARSRVFERFGIDFCCGGHRPLNEACAERGVSSQTVVEALMEVDNESAGAPQRDWSAASLSSLIEHILDTHHRYLKEELPRLAALLDKVTQVHGERHPSLHECRRVFAGLREELESHMAKEETVLFPMIARMEASQVIVPEHCGSVQNPIRVMEAEHDGAGNALTILRDRTDGYTVPADACGSYRALLDGLHTLEQDLHQHIHKENNILFPRAIRLEAELAEGRCTHAR